LVRLFAATGERTGEALGTNWTDFDEKAKVLNMTGNIIQPRGKGVIRNDGKTDTSQRPIPLPDWCVAMLVERRTAAEGAKADLTGPIFANNAGNHAWNPFLERAGYEWVTSRTFRRTVATLLDDGGISARQIADVLGHAWPSMTQDVYMGRKAAQAFDFVAKESA
jgi:integrase